MHNGKVWYHVNTQMTRTRRSFFGPYKDHCADSIIPYVARKGYAREIRWYEKPKLAESLNNTIILISRLSGLCLPSGSRICEAKGRVLIAYFGHLRPPIADSQTWYKRKRHKSRSLEIVIETDIRDAASSIRGSKGRKVRCLMTFLRHTGKKRRVFGMVGSWAMAESDFVVC